MAFCFWKMSSEPGRIPACKLRYTKAAGSTQYITIFQSNPNSSQSKDKSTVLYICFLVFFPFFFFPLSFFIFHPHSLPIVFFSPFCNFTSTASSSSLSVLLQEQFVHSAKPPCSQCHVYWRHKLSSWMLASAWTCTKIAIWITEI